MLAVLVVIGMVLLSIVGAGVAGYVVYRRAKVEMDRAEQQARDERDRSRSEQERVRTKVGSDESVPTMAVLPPVPATPTVPSTHDPRIIETVKHDDYKLTGNTEGELRHEMDAEGPIDQAKHFDAHTAWFVRWSYPFDRSDNQCGTGPVTVKLEITYTFPEWDGDPNAPPGLVDKWRRYEAALQTHESGHAEHGRDAADEIEHALSDLPPAANCPAMDQIANDKANAILAAHARDDVTYDRDTDHGATQGARFP